MRDGRGDCAGAFSLFSQFCFGCQVIPRVSRCWTDIVKPFSQPTNPPLFHGKHVIIIFCFHCFFSGTMPGGCRSHGCHGYRTRSVQFALGLHYPIRHYSPSSYTVDEFICTLQVKTQLFSEVVLPNAPFGNKQLHHSLS